MYTAKQTYSENEIQLNYGVETNHLGNVLATISARPRLIFDYTSNPPVYEYREADVLSVSDYEPGGFPTPGRQFNSESYRFGHNTQEKVDEWNGTTGTHYTALYWEYDSRLIWRQNPDPKSTSFVSPYSCFGGNPIFNVDILGDNIDDYKLNSKTGEISKIRTTDDKTDKLYAQGENGTIDTKKSITVQKGILNKQMSTENGTSIFASLNTKDLKKLYDFTTSNSNVEWAISNFQYKNTKFSLLNTSHSESNADVSFTASVLYNNKDVSLTFFDHSHPGLYNPENNYPAYPSGFKSDYSPDKFEGDRRVYFYSTFLKNKVPEFFNITVPSVPNIEILYNDKVAFPVYKILMQQ